MSAPVLVRIEGELARLLAERAMRDGVSAEEEARTLLESALAQDWMRFWADVDRIHDGFAGRVFSDSAELIREDRDR